MQVVERAGLGAFVDGDEACVEVADSDLVQAVERRIEGVFVTHDRDGAVLAPSSRARLTLVTCWPFDAPIPGGPQRYVVVAEASGGPADSNR